MRGGRLAGVGLAVVLLVTGVTGRLAHGRAGAGAGGVTTVSGTATAFFSTVSLFGGPATQRGPAGTPGCDAGQPPPGPLASPTEGCSPTVSLPARGSESPLTASAAQGVRAVYGPAVVFGGGWDDGPIGPPSGPVVVTTEGTTGPHGSVKSSVSFVRSPVASSWVPPGQTVGEPWPGGLGPGPLLAAAVTSTCQAGGGTSGVTGTTSISGGVLGLTTDVYGSPATFAPMPEHPRPNDGPHHGVITNVGDSYDVYYNEQDRSVPGRITVTAIHMKLLGPIAVGDLYVGRVECAVHG